MDTIKIINKKKNKWGNSIWIFFHTLVEKINENQYDKIIIKLIDYIYKICELLPCETCSKKSIQILNKLDLKNNAKNKEQLKFLIFKLHNIVNLKTKKKVEEKIILDNYLNNNIMIVYENFIKSFKPKIYILFPYNEKHEKIKILLEEFENWLIENFNYHFL